MKVYELLEKPEAWIRENFARNKDGVMVDESSPDAVCWCLDGAVCRVYPDVQDQVRVKSRIRVHLQNKGYGTSIWGFNDEIATHEAVVALCKELDI
jgi:hypothetical protein